MLTKFKKALAIPLPRWFPGLRIPLQVGLAVGLLTAILSLFQSNYYRSQAVILPIESKGVGGLGSLTAAAAAFGLNLGSDNSDANFVDIINSRWVREKLLNTSFTFSVRNGRFGARQVRTQTLMGYLKAKSMDQGVARVGSVLVASRDPRSKILSITAETRSPELSMALVQKTSALLESFVQGKGRTRGGFKAAFASARLDEARQEMGVAESDLERFLDRNRNYQVSADPTIRLQGLRLETELKLRQQLVLTLSMNREQALMEEKNDVPVLNILDPGSVPTEKSKPARAMRALLATLVAALFAWTYLNREWLIKIQREGRSCGC